MYLSPILLEKIVYTTRTLTRGNHELGKSFLRLAAERDESGVGMTALCLQVSDGRLWRGRGDSRFRRDGILTNNPQNPGCR